MPKKCAVPECKENAAYEVILYDVSTSTKEVYYKQHDFCQFLCEPHMVENEKGAENGFDDKRLRKYRGHMKYPYTKSRANGFVIYRPL
jgi:hypothetical protein